MTFHLLRRRTLALTVTLLCSSTAEAQWLTQPAAGIPRAKDGTLNVSAPAPRTHDGKPDLSGVWRAGATFESDFKPSDAQAWAQTRSREREANPASDSWATLCVPPGPMIAFTGPFRIVQTPQMVTVLYEVPNNFRQIFTDGRALPKDPNPTWQGYSIARWDGDTLVVETIGFNDKSIVGRPGYPHTEALRVTERYRRRDFGHIDLHITIDDAKTFARPWMMRTELVFEDTELIEFVCTENEKDRQHFVQPQSTSSAEFHVDPMVLAKYAGVYQVMTPRGPSKATITVQGDQLMIDVPGLGGGRLVPQSATMFGFRGSIIEFLPNEKGVDAFIAHAVEGDFKAQRLAGP
jgi:hypothetical protein